MGWRSAGPTARRGARGWCSMSEARRIAETIWEIPADARPDMRVPARVFADEELFEAIATDGSLEQTENVATLPGIAGVLREGPRGFPGGGGVGPTEGGGCPPGAAPAAVSERAHERGSGQL